MELLRDLVLIFAVGLGFLLASSLALNSREYAREGAVAFGVGLVMTVGAVLAGLVALWRVVFG